MVSCLLCVTNVILIIEEEEGMKKEHMSYYCPHCISQLRYPIAIDIKSIINQTIKPLACSCTSAFNGKKPMSKLYCHLTYSIVHLHLDVTTENKMDSKKGKNYEIASL